MAQKKFTCNWQVKHGDKGKAKTYQAGDPITIDEAKAATLVKSGALASFSDETEATKPE